MPLIFECGRGDELVLLSRQNIFRSGDLNVLLLLLFWKFPSFFVRKQRNLRGVVEFFIQILRFSFISKMFCGCLSTKHDRHNKLNQGLIFFK